jgi:TonB family protein
MASSTVTQVLYRVYELPWSTGAAQERKFLKTVQIAIGVVVLAALLLSMLPVPEPDPNEVVEVPRRVARLVLERQAPPPPPPVVREEPEPAPEPEPVVVEQREVTPEPPPVPKPEPVPEPEVDRAQLAREKASVSGLLPFAQQLASLRDESTAQRLDRTQVAGAVEGASPLAERSLITSSVGSSSGGINTAALSRNTGGGGLSDRTVTQVDNPVDGFEIAGGAAQRSGVSDKSSRSREEIERVFDQNKGAIYSLYNRALRQNPALEGKLVLRLTINADGRVTFCEVVSSELNDPDLEQKLVQRVLLFQFEPRDVESITTTKPIDFFPA